MPFAFDAEALASDAHAIAEHDWERHFNTGYYEGDWSGVALRSTGGRVSLYPDPTATDAYADTALLERCPNIRAALAKFACPLTSVRLLRLGPGAHVREHRDYQLGFDDGEVRLHVPVVSGPGVEFVLDGVPLEMTPGDCWYVEVNLPHRVANPGPGPRIHLVIDCIVDEWLRSVMLRTAST